MDKIFEICIPNSKRDSFSYKFDADVMPGMRVQVPFRKSTKLGIVIEKQELDPDNVKFKLKAVDKVLDIHPILSAEMLALLQWIASYYQAPLSEVIPLALPKKYRVLNTNTKKAKVRKVTQESTEKQSEALPNSIVLNEEQTQASNTILKYINEFRPFLLLGVTGSGKTEVYLKVIIEVLKQGKQVLVLVPEIGLTPQLIERFKERLQVAEIYLYHSFITDTQRFKVFDAVNEGKAKIVIGTRCSVFNPFKNLGLIVVDEEHDSSYKQQEGVRYSARDVAVMRAFRANIPIILGTATPSLESYHNVLQNRYQLLELKQRALTTEDIKFHIQDIRNLRLKSGLSQPTLDLIKTHLVNGNQVLVFINKRGFAPIYLCRECAHVVDCRACDNHLTYHQRTKKLICHKCGLNYPIFESCIKCKSDKLVPVGVGTERVVEYLQKKFEEFNVLKIDRDEVSKKNAFAECLEKIANKTAQLIVGTQMLAKGHHFPDLSLVVVLDADYGFFSPDFRALETLGQLLIQVAGRAGRASVPGEVLIQTHVPKHQMLNILIQKGYMAFVQQLLAMRQEIGLPPFGYLAIIRAKAIYKAKALNFLKECKTNLNNNELSIFGPAPAPLARKNNYYRFQLLIKASSRAQIQKSLSNLRNNFIAMKSINGVIWNIDVDPMDLS